METKTAIVTGTSSGIGLALARAFLERGYAVIGNARTLSRLKKASEALDSPDRFVPVVGAGTVDEHNGTLCISGAPHGAAQGNAVGGAELE